MRQHGAARRAPIRPRGTVNPILTRSADAFDRMERGLSIAYREFAQFMKAHDRSRP